MYNTLLKVILAHSGVSKAPLGDILSPKYLLGAPEGLWSQLPPIGLTGLESWLPDTLTWYLASSGPPEPPKGPVLAPKGPFEGPRETFCTGSKRVSISRTEFLWLELLEAPVLILLSEENESPLTLLEKFSMRTGSRRKGIQKSNSVKSM